jgi:hypothetical protein
VQRSWNYQASGHSDHHEKPFVETGARTWLPTTCHTFVRIDLPLPPQKT